MNHKSFKSQYLWKRIKENWMNTYECVALAKQYSKDVLWFPLWAFGWSALSGWENKKNTFPPYYWEKIVNTASFVPLVGDICFFNQTTSNDFWHVAICDYWCTKTKLFVVEQNWWKWSGTWIGTDAVRVKEYDYITPRFLGCMRKK
jgi:hypothetical protein